MEGYSVTEAASILGVPTERVWELLARGVLAGAPEGETGMRVYLQPRPAPAPPVPEASRPNGNGGTREPERELSPFRELLTEFRNLTERYGQALLALGEARGEVAALRSRVDLLEARMDLRLPMTAAPMTPPTPWPTPMPTGPMPDEPPLREVTAEEAEDEEERPRRRRTHRRATESFAEALARAEDPTRPELPGAAETAAALAALREEGHAEAAEAVLPRELPAAESIPSAEEPGPPMVEAAAEEPIAEPEAEPPVVEAAADEPIAEPEAEPPVVEAAAEEPIAEPEAEPPMVEAAADQPIAQATAEEPAAAPEPVTEEPESIAWDPERYTVEISEPDWYADEEIAAVTSVAAPPVEGEPAREAGVDEPEAATEAPSVPEIERHEPAAEPPVAEPTAAAVGDEETMLWFGTAPAPAGPDAGAEEMEVVGTTRPPGPEPIPGSQELDDALAQLEALAHPTAEPPPTPPPTMGAEAAPPDEDRPTADRIVPPVGTITSLTKPSATPASRAYRRLRRIFPG